MAFVDTTWYVTSVGWTAVTAWATGTVTAAGTLRRQNAAPTVGNERVFVCIVAGTTHATTEPTWTVTRGAKTTDNTVTWQECTGSSAINGDVTNTQNWTTVKNTAVSLGQIIKRNNAASYQICSTAGTAGNGSEPAFSDTAGTTTADNTVTWTSLGVVGNFTGNQGPHARLQNATATNWAAAGNTIWVKSDHAQTQSSNCTINGGTVPLPIYVYCHNGSNYPPTVSNLTTGATVTTTSTAGIDLSPTGMYIYGITFSAGTGNNSSSFLTVGQVVSAAPYIVLDNCSLQTPSTGTSGTVINIVGVSVPQSSRCEWRNTSVKFGAVAQYIWVLNTDFVWTNGSLVAGTTAPTNLFNYTNGSNAGAKAVIEGCDLSLATNSVLVAQGTGPLHSSFVFKDCKLHSGFSVTTATAPSGANVDLIRCDSSGTNYKSYRYRYQGTETTETTIVRTGGATDGVQQEARKLVTTANSLFINPFEMQPITIWNDSTSSVTLNVYGIWGGGAVPTNQDIWFDAVYHGDSGSPLGSFATTAKANNLTTAASHSTDSSTWGGSTTAFKMSTTFTPALKGPITVYVKAAAPSTTFYIDPKLELTGATIPRVFTISPGIVVNRDIAGSATGGSYAFC